MFPFNPEYNYLWAVKNSKIPLPPHPHAATKFWQGWENWRTLKHSFARKSQADYDIIASHFHSPCLLVRKNRRPTCTIPTGCGFTQKNRWQKETTKNASHRRPPCHCRYGAALEQNPKYPGVPMKNRAVDRAHAVVRAGHHHVRWFQTADARASTAWAGFYLETC